jgi:hypothetical protein
VTRLVELNRDQTIAENRRWFSSNDMDVIIWIDENRSIKAFELYYDKNVNEHVLVWRDGSGFSHLAVDDGEQKPVLNYKETPILIPDGVFEADRIMRLFETTREDLPAELFKFVHHELGKLTASP